MSAMLQKLFAAALVLSFGLTLAASADTSGGKTVEQLAREGYWGQEDTWAEHSQLIGKPAPDLSLSEWINGEVKPASIQGKILVVDYWATWCGPCIAAIPHNNKIAKDYATKGVLVIGACGGGGEEKMSGVVEKHNMQYPTAKVTRESTKAWNVKWWPTYAVVDRKGNVRAIGIQPSYVEKVVDAILKEQPAK